MLILDWNQALAAGLPSAQLSGSAVFFIIFIPIVLFCVWVFTAIKRRLAVRESLNEKAGFAYDPEQDIFYSMLDTWQRKYGYCQLYDEAAASMSMIIDCEPVRFAYGGKQWLIELWKGQYGMTCGGEIGVYSTTGPDLEIPGFFDGTFYDRTDELLKMSFKLFKDQRLLFSRKERHWWLTGFILGEYSEPSELTMAAKITFPDGDMLDAFVDALKGLGYTRQEYRVRENASVDLVFSKPYSPQPVTRTEMTDRIIQKKNKLTCDIYHELTDGLGSAVEKIEMLKKKNPKLYKQISRAIRPKGLYTSYNQIKRYI